MNVSPRARGAGLSAFGWIGLIGEILLGTAALLWACVAILGSMAGDTADLSLGGAWLAVFAIIVAVQGRQREWKWHWRVAALLALSTILSLLDIGAARNWFE